MIRLGLLGASGKMGQHVIRLIESDYKKTIHLQARASKGEPIAPLLIDTDVVMDFSTTEAMADLAKLALANTEKSQNQPKQLPAFVIGSTGWKIDDRREVEALAQKTAVVLSPNFSTGIMALLEILHFASPLLEKIKYTPVLVETHHRGKKDTPSGTALSIQRVVSPFGPGNLQTHSIRAGEVVGNHEVTFYGPSDRISLGHFANDRSIFARGALEVALWLAEKISKGELEGMPGGIPRGIPRGIIDTQTFFKERYLS